MAARAASISRSGAPVASATMRRERARSFSFKARTSTIRFPYVLPSRIMVSVETMLSTSFWAVPALSRVEPVSSSGPTTTSMPCSAAAARAEPALQASPTVRAPRSRAYVTAPTAYGVRPEAETPTTLSRSVSFSAARSAADSSALSSAPSIGVTSASGPPAMRPMTWSRAALKVGGHSLASSTPSLPAVPAPA